MFLGFFINSVKMTVKLTAEKKNSLHEACNDLLLHKIKSVRRVAQVMGMIMSSKSGVKYGGSGCIFLSCQIRVSE